MVCSILFKLAVKSKPPVTEIQGARVIVLRQVMQVGLRFIVVQGAIFT